MALDPYSSCPCGSGKKFKWCCQPIHEEMERVFEQDAEGQHDTALRLMDEVIARHPDNPEVWGQKARLLFQLERADEADAALEKAMQLNPNYPFGLYLSGRFRQFEGELAGAALLFRKAADLYDPGASWILAEIYSAIAEIEMKLNRPVAARAALRLAMRHEPNSIELSNALEQLFGEKSRYPQTARREYTFAGPPAGASPERKAAWERALREGGTGKLTDAAAAFERLTAAEDDAGAWYNLAVVRAWLGENARAVESLDRYMSLEADEAKASAAWTLAEVMRCGQGMQDDSDYREHSTIMPMRDGQAVVRVFGDWEQQRRLIGVQVNQEEGLLTGMVLERCSA
jgi:tetratricopeptide (TPR) repeat protein